MSKITAEHLARKAMIYVRQSSLQQVRDNPESQGWQYDLASRAAQLGWSDVIVVDDDLGRSGGGTERPGFERMLAAVCDNQVGVILAVEASRLSRNGREWHTLIEFCGLVGCLLADERTVYDPRLPNDRLLLGLHGSLSELELSNIRTRSLEGARRKAMRGELFTSVAIGYRRVGRDSIETDPDLRVREAVALVFRKFEELQSIRQVHLWLIHEGIELPAPASGQDPVVWKLPGYSQVHRILTNPVYAGAYAFGRSRSRSGIRDGRKRVTRGHTVARDDWIVLKKANHPGYITWEVYERNQRVISGNTTKYYPQGARGSVRNGEALLAGLLRCGHCGRKIQVSYCGAGHRVVRYICRLAHINQGKEQCISFGGLRVDEAIGGEVVRALRPVGVEAALQAIEDSARESSETIRQAELALERARYEAGRAGRQYDAVDFENRQVAGELERRWNERLIAVQEIEARLSDLRSRPCRQGMSAEERAACMDLGADLERAWTHHAVTPQVRKRILRAALEEVVARVEGKRIKLLLHWRGGDHTEIDVPKHATGQHRYSSDAETVQIITETARLMPDRDVAALLNRLGRPTGKGNSWTEAHVRSFRSYRHIPAYREGERQERNELNLAEAARRLGVGKSTMLRLIRAKRVPARQSCKGAPWVISGDDLASMEAGAPSDPRQDCLFDLQERDHHSPP